jgi:hypothetical protein
MDRGAPTSDKRVLRRSALISEEPSADGAVSSLVQVVVACWSLFLVVFGVKVSLASLSSTKLSVSRSMRLDSIQTRL